MPLFGAAYAAPQLTTLLIAEFVEVERDTIYYSIDGFEIGFSNNGGIKHLYEPLTKVHFNPFLH